MDHLSEQAQKDQNVRELQNMLRVLESAKAKEPGWEKTLDDCMDGIARRIEKKSKPNEFWDFSLEKSLPELIRDDVVVLRPVTPDDQAFYQSVRLQHSMIYRAEYHTTTAEKQRAMFLDEALAPQVFFCIIEDAQTCLPLGFLGIKDTRSETWEIAIELGRQYVRQGYGSRSLRLFLNGIHQITGQSVFRAVIDSDNVASQKCVESLGGELAGLCSSVVPMTEEEKTRFEEAHLYLIDDNIRSLAQRLGVEPRMLLSHPVEYLLKCPLQKTLSIKYLRNPELDTASPESLANEASNP